MSKGHASIIQYVILESLGILKKHDLDNYCKKKGILGVHPDIGNPGINASTGSLSGEAPESALGENYTFTMTVSDGQSQASLGPLSFSIMPPVFFINLELNDMDQYRDMDFELKACFENQEIDECSEEEELVTINDNGVYSFKKGIKTGNSFEIKIDRDPARQ